MEILFILALGGMIVFNGALIVYFLGNAYIIPQFLPQVEKFSFGESMIFVVLAVFLFVTLFGNRITRKKRKELPQKNPATLRYGEKRTHP